MTGPSGTLAVSRTISTECGRNWSWFLKWSVTVQPVGTVTVSAPPVKPLKFRPPLAGVSAATSVTATERAALSARSHPGSTAGPDVCAASATLATARSIAPPPILVASMFSSRRRPRTAAS